MPGDHSPTRKSIKKLLWLTSGYPAAPPCDAGARQGSRVNGRLDAGHCRTPHGEVFRRETPMTEPLFYVVEIDLPADDPAGDLAIFRAWYANVHAPHLYEAGFTTCTSYRGIAGAMQIVDIYQAPDWSIFESARFARYRRIAAADPHLPAFMPAIPNIRTPYVPAVDGEAEAAPLAADWVTIWRLDADAALTARLADWLSAEGEALFRDRGIDRVRLLRRTRPAPTGTSNRPAAALVLESARRPADDIVDAGAAPDVLRQALGKGPHFCGYRLYPWPDDGALMASEAD